jgi:tetratricopeptide (TPR) repeat protein
MTSISTNVSNISPGLSKQNFIIIDSNQPKQGTLYEKYMLKDEWNDEAKEPTNEPTDQLVLITDEVSIENAKRRADVDILVSSIIQLDNWETSRLIFDDLKVDEIKDSLIEKANFYYESAIKLYEESQFERAIVQCNKALNLNSYFLKCALLKCELFVEIGDMKSAISNLNKLYSYLVSLSKNDQESQQQSDSFEQLVADKLSLYYYLQAQMYFDCKFYLEALDSFTKASELQPNNLTFKIRR